MAHKLQVGDTVRIPWGLEGDVEAKVIEIWGNPPTQVRVQMHLAGDDESEPVVLLLAPSALSAA